MQDRPRLPLTDVRLNHDEARRDGARSPNERPPRPHPSDEVLASAPLSALHSLVLPTKLHPPRQNVNRITRTRLLAQLDAARTKLTLLVAPAGYGKTTLLSQWVRRRSEPVAWLTLSPDDNAFPVFLSALMAAIGQADQDLIQAAVRQKAEAGRFDAESMFAAVLSELATCRTPWTLVLDDYHLIDNPEIDHVMRQLLEHTPNEFRIVIAGRTAPSLPLARLRMHEELTLYDANELRVTSSELPDLLTGYGLAASPSEQQALEEHTNGWIAALHLAAMTARAQSLDEVLKSLAAMDGDFDLLSDYLLHEVLNQQPPELRTFLLHTSVLDRFTVAACHAVTQSAHAGRLFEQIQRRNLFLVPLDESGDWFHYHHLFRDFLRRRLGIEADPDVVAGLHAAASGWFEQHGFLGEAITHASNAGDWPRAAASISKQATWIILQQGENDLLAWLLSFPFAILCADANVSSLAAYALIRQGRSTEAEPFLEAADRLWRTSEDANGLALVNIVRSTLARFRDDDAALIRHASEAIAYATGEQSLDDYGRLGSLAPRLLHLDGTWMGQIGQQLSYAHLAMGLRLRGRLPEAAAVYRGIEDAFLASGFELTDTYYAPEAAFIRLAQGLLTEADALCRAFLEHNNLASEQMLAKAVLGEVLREWNQLADSEDALREGIALAARFDTPIFLPVLYCNLARTQWSQGDSEAALASLDAASGAAVGVQNARRAHEAAALRVRIALAAGDFAPARRWVAARGFAAAGPPKRVYLHEQLVYARVLMAQDESSQAATLLTDLSADAERDGRLHDLLHIEVLRSMVFLDLVELDRAIAILQAALELAAPEGYLRVFLDEGVSMRRLLRTAQRRGAQVGYIQRLLTAVGEAPGEVVRVMHRDLVEPITARELEVLRLMVVGLSNRELSDELVISVATVKRHVANLYGKLEVSSRAEAVHKARKLGLISEQPTAVPERTRFGLG